MPRRSCRFGLQGYFFQDNGIFNYYLSHLGLPTVHWLTSAQSAMPSIVFMDVWKNTGFFMIIFIAALQGVPKTIMEAAIMDGTSPWRRFWRITLPWISPWCVLRHCLRLDRGAAGL